MTTLSDTIRRARQELGLTLTNAAPMVGLSRTALHRLENGDSPVTMEKLQAVAQAYGLVASDMLDGVTKPEGSARKGNDLGLIFQAVASVLGITHVIDPQPQPTRVAATVVEMVRLLEEDQKQNPGSSPEPARYAGLIRASLGV